MGASSVLRAVCVRHGSTRGLVRTDQACSVENGLGFAWRFLLLCLALRYYLFFFFFQAEDGIRDADVTGVQTCALPIYIAKSKPASGGPTPGASPGSPGSPGLAAGSTDPKQIIQAAGCLACHKLEGQGQVIAPDLTHVGSRRDADSIRRKILDPASSITQGYEKFAGIMPKTFGSMMSASQLEALVEYLAGHK